MPQEMMVLNSYNAWKSMMIKMSTLKGRYLKTTLIIIS